MITMEDRWDDFNKRYPDTDYQALKDAHAWQSDREYLSGHLMRIVLESGRFHFSIRPATAIFGLNDLIQETYMAVHSMLGEKEALIKAFRIHDITIHVVSNLKEDPSEDNIREWLDWKAVVYYYSSGFVAYIPSGVVGHYDLNNLRKAIAVVERKYPHCPECGAVGWRSEINNLGQTVYWCDTWMCSSRFTSDTDN